MRPLRSIVVLAICAALAPAGSARATVPLGLPLRFGIGISALPDASGLDGWMPDSGIPFDYAYQYLAAGVNTGNGWATWNDNGTFVTNYAARASALHAIPVFPYYMLLQSNGPCDACGESEKDLAHLNSTSLMASYYADFRLLMQRLGPRTYGGVRGYGGRAIVHVEPDLSGYANQAVLDPAGNCDGHCTGTGNNPSLLRASVASSGVADVRAYPNTFTGFMGALAHLRDLYAPGVLLALHVSNWAPLRDIGSESDASLDPVALGRTAGSFALQTASGYQLVFNDVADRDAGYYKNEAGRDTWWDKLNVDAPNFKRWESYIGTVSRTTGKQVMVWQIPVGNQYFRSENNSDGHYQDNRAEYFFGHTAELRAAGIIALLFGRGNDGSTTYNDDQSDGVTNPAALCTSDGVSSGQVCNDHTATSSDDDGGYLRMASRAYYDHAISLLYVSRASAASFRSGGTTRIGYTLSLASTVAVVIRDSAGRTVRVLAQNSRQASGAHTTPWDGRDSSGRVVRAGSYRYVISASIGIGTPAVGGGTLAVS